MGMKLKSGADLCGFQLTNFCVQGEASAPSDAALGRKYFHTNATDDVATGISLLNRERIYLGEGAWRATAYLDDIANLQGKIDALDELLNGEDSQTYVDTWEEVKAFLEGVTESKDLMELLNAKADKTQLADYLPLSGGGVILGEGAYAPLVVNANIGQTGVGFRLQVGGTNKTLLAWDINIGTYMYNTPSGKYIGVKDDGTPYYNNGSYNTLIHSGNIGSQKVAGLATPVTIWGQSFDGTGDIANNTAGTMRRLLFHDTFNDSGTTGYIGKASSSNNDVYVNSTYNLRLMSGDNYTMWLNSSGNVTIGGSDLAGTSTKLYVSNGDLWIRNTSGESRLRLGVNAFVGYNDTFTFIWEADSRPIAFGTSAEERMRIMPNGNVLIGTTTDDESGAKFQVDGGGITIKNGTSKTYSYIRSGNYTTNTARLRIGTCYGYGVEKNAIEIYNQDVRIFGNLIVDGEVSAGGAGAEEGTSGSGSAEGVAYPFTPTSTSMAFDHNLGEDVIVQVYEKSGNVWNMVIVDTEITSATRVTLRFGKTETTQHKVVIMGV